MPDYLKGNYKVNEQVESSNDEDNDNTSSERLEKEFERRALEKLGGSIAFVVKPSFVWTGDDDGQPG